MYMNSQITIFFSLLVKRCLTFLFFFFFFFFFFLAYFTKLTVVKSRKVQALSNAVFRVTFCHQQLCQIGEVNKSTELGNLIFFVQFTVKFCNYQCRLNTGAKNARTLAASGCASSMVPIDDLRRL